MLFCIIFLFMERMKKEPKKTFCRLSSYPESFSCICAPTCKQSNSFNFFNNNFYCFNIFSILTIFSSSFNIFCVGSLKIDFFAHWWFFTAFLVIFFKNQKIEIKSSHKIISTLVVSNVEYSFESKMLNNKIDWMNQR